MDLFSFLSGVIDFLLVVWWRRGCIINHRLRMPVCHFHFSVPSCVSFGIIVSHLRQSAGSHPLTHKLITQSWIQAWVRWHATKVREESEPKPPPLPPHTRDRCCPSLFFPRVIRVLPVLSSMSDNGLKPQCCYSFCSLCLRSARWVFIIQIPSKDVNYVSPEEN